MNSPDSVHVVSNACPLILLSRIDRLDLLPKLFERITVPQNVLEEVTRPEKTKLHSLASATWVKIQGHNPREPLFLTLRGEVDAGEASAITLASLQKADLLLIDERLGRRAATRLGLTVKGTVGILIAAKRDGLLTALEPELERLVDAGAWVSPKLIEAALKSVDE